jgi:hypothetical protein
VQQLLAGTSVRVQNPEGVNQNRYLYDSWTLGLITSSVLQLEMHVYSLSYSIWSLTKTVVILELFFCAVV